MPLFGDLIGEVVGRIPGLSPLLAQTFINRAYQNIREEREWSFLEWDGALVCPAAVSTGFVAIVQGASTVTLDAAATAALATGIPTPPGITGVQIRFMGTTQTSQIYNILQQVGSVLTLDRAVQEATNAVSQYLVYRVYITPPIADFKRWLSVVDMVNGFPIVGRNLTYSSAYFDARDPQRQALGLGYFLGFYKGSSVNNTTDSTPIYELWPGSTQGQRFYCRFQRRGTDPAPTDPVPTVLDSEIIVEQALAKHVYPHCMANIGHFPAMKGVNWTELVEISRGNYMKRLAFAKITDDETAMKSVLARGHGLKSGSLSNVGFPYPIDSNFFQSHPIFW